MFRREGVASAMDEVMETQNADHIGLAVEIVSAYVSNNSIPPSDLQALVTSVHAALISLSKTPASEAQAVEKLTPAQIRKSITHDNLISFEDGKPYKTLRRHLKLHGLSPEAYREKWGLPSDYPITSAAYSEKRAALARAAGLGQQDRRRYTAPSEASETAEMEIGAPAKPRRQRKAKEPAEA